MHRAGRGGGQVVEDEVAVGGAVDRVGADVLEAEVAGDRVAVDLPVDSGQGAGAERHHRRRCRARTGSAARRGRASRSRRAGDGRGRPAGRAAGGCSRASASPGGARPAPAAAPSPSPASSIARSECACTTIATSVATWSLRERPVWSLPASGPISSPSRRSIAMWMSSSALVELEAVLAHAGAHPLQAGVDLAPAPRRRGRRSRAAPRACAWDWSMS